MHNLTLKVNMVSSDFYFCLLPGKILGEEEKWIAIVPCPVVYWNENQCLPEDGHCFNNDIEPLMSDYLSFWGHEEIIYASEKSLEETRKEILALGLIENLEMQKFLEGCWQ